jgi:hypothetical protein
MMQEVHVYLDSSTAHGTEARLASRSLARWAAIVVHLLGALVPGFLMFTTEGPAAGANGAVNVDHAKMELALIVVFAAAQAVALIVWRHRSRAVRAAANRVAAPQGYRDRVDRGAVKAAVGMLFAVGWVLEIGYVAQAFTSMGGGGYSDQTSGLAIGMIVLAVGLAFVAVVTGGLALLTVRTSEATTRDMQIAAGIPIPVGGFSTTGSASAPLASAPLASAPLASAPDTGARIAALSRMRRRATAFMVVSIVLMAGLAALAAAAVATGQWQLRYAVMIPTFFLISLSRVALSVKARRATSRAIRVLGDQGGVQHVARHAAGHGQESWPPVHPVPERGPGTGW